MYKMLDSVTAGIGRYPIGYRHLESYENYRIDNPEATMQDYAEEMNSEIHFDEFLNIMRAAAIEESQSPEFLHRHSPKRDYFELDESVEKELQEKERILGQQNGQAKLMNHEFKKKLKSSAYEMIMSPFFEQEARKKFVEKQQNCLLKQKYFTKVDCLDDTIDMFMYGRNKWTLPAHNAYIPVRHTILPKPNLAAAAEDIFRFND